MFGKRLRAQEEFTTRQKVYAATAARHLQRAGELCHRMAVSFGATRAIATSICVSRRVENIELNSRRLAATLDATLMCLRVSRRRLA